MTAANNVDISVSTYASGILQRCKEVLYSIISTACFDIAIICSAMFSTSLTTAKDTTVDNGTSRRCNITIGSPRTTNSHIDMVTRRTKLCTAIDIPLDGTACDIDRRGLHLCHSIP